MVEGINRIPPYNNGIGSRIPQPNSGDDRLRHLVSECCNMKTNYNTQEMMIILQQLREASRQKPDLLFMLEETLKGLSHDKNWLEAHPDALNSFFDELQTYIADLNHPGDT